MGRVLGQLDLNSQTVVHSRTFQTSRDRNCLSDLLRFRFLGTRNLSGPSLAHLADSFLHFSVRFMRFASLAASVSGHSDQ